MARRMGLGSMTLILVVEIRVEWRETVLLEWLVRAALVIRQHSKLWEGLSLFSLRSLTTTRIFQQIGFMEIKDNQLESPGNWNVP